MSLKADFKNQKKVRRDEIYTVDLFCGGGGTSTGLDAATAAMHLAHKGLAINHWDVAVNTMRRNHPDVDTKCMSIEAAVPADLVPGGVVDILCASPSCTHHSRAKGGRPRSNQLRSQPELILTWLDQLFVRRVIVENVPEFVDWGPLNANGQPIKSLVGSCFRAWVAAIEARNYTVEWRVVNCADYGDATTRRRFFLKAVRKGCGRISWPEPTHAEHPEPDLFGMRRPWRAIRECLDFEDIGRSVFSRKKPLSEKTMLRIADGMRKYCGIDMNPFLVKMYGTGKSNSIDKPISTITAGGEHYALCQPFLVKSNNNQTVESVDGPLSTIVAGTVHHALCTPFVCDHTNHGKARSIDRPIPAQTTKEHVSLITPMVLGQNGGSECRPIDCPAPTIETRGAIRLITPFVVDNANGGIIRGTDDPLNTVTVKDQHMGVFPILEDGRVIDIFIRMLKPSELAAAHSFPIDYVLTGTRTEQVKQIGNSVPVQTAKAMCLSDLEDIQNKRKSLPPDRRREVFGAVANARPGGRVRRSGGSFCLGARLVGDKP